jgi:hypothetical protein
VLRKNHPSFHPPVLHPVIVGKSIFLLESNSSKNRQEIVVRPNHGRRLVYHHLKLGSDILIYLFSSRTKLTTMCKDTVPCPKRIHWINGILH